MNKNANKYLSVLPGEVRHPKNSKEGVKKLSATEDKLVKLLSTIVVDKVFKSKPGL